MINNQTIIQLARKKPETDDIVLVLVKSGWGKHPLYGEVDPFIKPFSKLLLALEKKMINHLAFWCCCYASHTAHSGQRGV